MTIPLKTQTMSKTYGKVGIKQIIALKPQKASLPTRLVMGDSITTDTKGIANAFNDFFSNIGSKLTKSIPEVPNISPLD